MLVKWPKLLSRYDALFIMLQNIVTSIFYLFIIHQFLKTLFWSNFNKNVTLNFFLCKYICAMHFEIEYKVLTQSLKKTVKE